MAGRIWIGPEEGGDLFERSGWAGGENEEKVEAAIGLGWNWIRRIPRERRQVGGGGGVRRMGQLP